MYKYFLKRIIDLLIAIIGILVLLPVFLIVFIILLFSNNGKPFFFQSRPGKDENIFKIVKFKTMNDKRDVNGDLLAPDNRITPLGNFLRKTSLDEIPQLINVIKGDMSLVGPRPLLIKYLPLYSDEQKKRHTVKPGITGLAQVMGRNSLSWKQKFEFDVRYINELSFFLDVKILFLTIKKVISNDGVYDESNTIVPDFKGSSENTNLEQ